MFHFLYCNFNRNWRNLKQNVFGLYSFHHWYVNFDNDDFLFLCLTVHIFLEPKEQIGLTNSTSEVICYANISAFEWRAVHLSYTNVSYSRIIISVFPNYTNPLVENGVTARIFNTDEIVNISFVLQIKEVPVLCNINLKLSCIVEFLDDFIETTTDIGNILITGNVVWVLAASVWL